MTTSPRIPVPTLQDTIERLDAIAASAPDYISRHSYITVRAHDGALLPFDMIAHLLQQLGRDLSVFTQDYDVRGPLTFSYTRGKFTTNNARGIQVLWDTIFEAEDLSFLGMARENGHDAAARFVVYILLAKLQKREDKGHTWADSLRLAKRDTIRYLQDTTSGFLAQTLGHHEDIRDMAIALLK